jgi:uncharacterized protein
VNEDVWKSGDDELFEEQLVELADYIIDHDLARDYICSLFTRHIGQPLKPEDDRNWCGAGKMLAVDPDGTFYPCVRFAPFSLGHKPGRPIGNCFDGVDRNKLRPFLAMTRRSQSTEECLSCDVASGCSWCSGCNYDMADSPTIYQRATFLCAMHKARVRANNYYWTKLEVPRRSAGRRARA